MSATPAWLLLAGAALLVPGTRRRRHRAARAEGARAAGLGRPVAILAVLAACVVTAGIRTGLLVAALAAAPLWLLLGHLRDRPAAVPPDPALPLTLDLAAAALRSGHPLARALELAAPLARADVAVRFQRVAGLLRLGAGPDQAWAVAARDGPLVPLARLAVRSAESGIKVAAAFERAAAELRSEQAAAGTARAHRAGVVALAPLAACFLPSFVCLGVVPVVVGIARSALVVLT